MECSSVFQLSTGERLYYYFRWDASKNGSSINVHLRLGDGSTKVLALTDRNPGNAIDWQDYLRGLLVKTYGERYRAVTWRIAGYDSNASQLAFENEFTGGGVLPNSD